MITRRDLLDGIAAAGGMAAAVAALAALGGLPAMPARAAAPALPRDGRRVLVLGGGIAGLVAAHEMQRAGWSVRVLEAAPRAGGRCLTLRAGDTVQETGGRRSGSIGRPRRISYFNPGPARIPHHHRGILGYCRALGVPLEVLVNENRAALLETPGGPVPLRRVQADIRGTVAELAVKGLGPGSPRRSTRPIWCGCARRCGPGARWTASCAIAAPPAPAGRCAGRGAGAAAAERAARPARADEPGRLALGGFAEGID